MTGAIDLISPTSDGVFALLDAAIDASVAEVATDPTPIEPGDTSERRFVIIGDIDSEIRGAKGEQAELLTVQIVVVYRGTQRSQLHSLMHLVRNALDGETPSAPGVAYGSIEVVGAASGSTGSDGLTRAGIIEIEVFAEPA